MAYVIHKLDVSTMTLGALCGSGQTRYQVCKVLVEINCYPFGEKQKFRLPKFGGRVAIINPLPKDSFVISAV